MNEVVRFPTKDEPELLIGPFEDWEVVVKGRRIPGLTGRKAADGGITFLVDRRFAGGPFFGETAHQVAYLLAQAMAIASGYSHFEADQRGRPFAPIAMLLDSGISKLGAVPE